MLATVALALGGVAASQLMWHGFVGVALSTGWLVSAMSANRAARPAGAP